MVLGQLSFPHGSDGKESICSVGYLGSIPGSGRSAGGGHGNPLQCCCLENPMNRGAWQATVHAVAKSPTRLSNTHTHTHTHTHWVNFNRTMGRSPGEGNGNPLQYSCLVSSMDREAWWSTVHGVAKS